MNFDKIVVIGMIILMYLQSINDRLWKPCMEISFFFKNIFVGGINARIPTGVSVHKVRILSCFNRRWGYEFFRYHLKNRMVAANSVMPPIV